MFCKDRLNPKRWTKQQPMGDTKIRFSPTWDGGTPISKTKFKNIKTQNCLQDGSAAIYRAGDTICIYLTPIALNRVEDEISRSGEGGFPC